MVVAFGSKR